MAGSWDEYFGTRRWRVAAEVTGTDTVKPAAARGNPVQVHFRKGKFEIEGGQFHSPLSTARGKAGILLQEIEQDGQDITGSRIAVGVVVYRKACLEGSVLK